MVVSPVDSRCVAPSPSYALSLDRHWVVAYPAALLSSAFSDQLNVDREALVNKLYEMLADGQIDEEDSRLISKPNRKALPL